MIKVYKNLMTPEDREEVLSLVKIFPDQYWTQSICTDESVDQLREFLPRTVIKKLYNIHQLMISVIEEDYNLNEKGIFLDSPDYRDLLNDGVLTIDRRTKGMSLHPHADVPTGTYEKEFGVDENGFTPITMSCVFYWNDDFQGGEIQFYENADWHKWAVLHEETDMSITYTYKPVAGDFIVFPSDVVHSIDEITSGERYSTQYFYNRIVN